MKPWFDWSYHQTINYSFNGKTRRFDRALLGLTYTLLSSPRRRKVILDTQQLNKHTHVKTKVYVKPTYTGLLQLHYKSHVDDQYKRALLKTMLDRTFRLSSNWPYFSEECDRLKLVRVFSTKIFWQSFKLYSFTVCCHQSIRSTCFRTCCQRLIWPHSCCPTV